MKWKPIRIHDLRHTYAALLIAQNANPKYIQAQLGHASIQVTLDTYGHLMPEVSREMVEKLSWICRFLALDVRLVLDI